MRVKASDRINLKKKKIRAGNLEAQKQRMRLSPETQK
jgi:hypothetical protein